MSTMRFADEVVPRRDIDELPSRKTKPAAKELKMAKQLIDSLASDWNPKQYNDTYVDELKRRIKAATRRGDKGSDVVEAEDTEEPTADVIDLTEALERSLAQKRPAAGSRRNARPKRKRTSA